MEVKIKDRYPETEQLRMALAICEFGVSYEQADLIQTVTREHKKLGGDFDLRDGARIFCAWKNKWEKYHSKNIENCK